MDAKHFDHDGDLLKLNRDPRSGEVTGLRDCFIGAGGCETWSFEHDARGQLTLAKAEHGASFSYAYDASGQRRRRSHGALEEVAQLADAQDRLLGYGGASFGYNAMGQRVTAVDTPTGDWTYDYDVNGGLRQVDGDNVRVERHPCRCGARQRRPPHRPARGRRPAHLVAAASIKLRRPAPRR